MTRLGDPAAAVASASSVLGLEPLWSGPATGGRELAAGMLGDAGKAPVRIIGRDCGETAAVVARLGQLAAGGQPPAVVILGDDLPAAGAIREWARRHDVSLYRSARSAGSILSVLSRLLAGTRSMPHTVQGVLLAVMNVGVLITGESGIGKSEVALDLVTRGHRLVADDAVHVERLDDRRVVGWCPAALKDHMEVRGLGILNLREMFGGAAIAERRTIDLIVRLEPIGRHPDHRLDRLRPSIAQRSILDVEVPEVLMFVAPGRNLAVLIEAAVRTHILRLEGRDPVDAFVARQQALIDDRALR